MESAQCPQTSNVQITVAALPSHFLGLAAAVGAVNFYLTSRVMTSAAAALTAAAAEPWRWERDVVYLCYRHRAKSGITRNA